MPALRFLGRRWHIASDDLPFPSLMGAVWHTAFIIVIAVDLSYVVNQLEPSCWYRTKQIGYLSAHLGCFIINSVLHSWTYFESIQGSIFEVQKRRRVAFLIPAVIVFYCLTIINNGYGTRLVYTAAREPQCPTVSGSLSLDHLHLLEAIMVATWVSLFIGFIAMLITFNLFSAYQAASSSWASRCKCCSSLCCCCLTTPQGREKSTVQQRSRSGSISGAAAEEGDADTSGLNTQASTFRAKPESLRRRSSKTLSPMVVIANVFTHVFGGIDMTFTDYVAAFTLVGAEHRIWKPALRYRNAPGPKWLEQEGICGGEGAAPASGKGGGVQPAGGALLLHPPAVMEMTAGGNGRSGGVTTPRGEPKRSQDGEEVPRAAAPPVQAPAPDLDALAADAAPAVSTTTPPTITTASVPNDASGGLATASSASSATSASSRGVHVLAAAVTMGPVGEALEVQVHSPGSQEAAASTPLPSTKAEEGGLAHQDTWDGRYEESNASIELMEEALHYLRFATAVYGWKMYLWMNRLRVQNCCKLCVGRGCGCCRQVPYFCSKVGPDTGPPEGCCSAAKLLEREAITQLTGVADEDILYVCYDNQVAGLLPYYIALDRGRRSVVVAIRGSLSLSDVVTDLVCSSAEFRIPGVPSKDEQGRHVLLAHRGMLDATHAILKDIRQQGLLETVLHGEQPVSERAKSIANRIKDECAGWRLVITGHSLGAGVTGLLGPLLRQHFPNLRCWAFAPPGGLMSPRAAELTRDFCISVIHAKDMIPRLGVGTMEQLVERLHNAAAHCKVSKAYIMGYLIALGRKPPLDSLLLPDDQLPPELRQILVKFDRRMRDAPSIGVRAALALENARDFEPPGHLLYIERRKEPGELEPCCSCNICLTDTSSTKASFACRWIRKDDFTSTGMVISRSMFLDHLPDHTFRAMKLALKQLRRAAGLQSASSASSDATLRSSIGKPSHHAAVPAPSGNGAAGKLDGPSAQAGVAAAAAAVPGSNGITSDQVEITIHGPTSAGAAA